jgi:hypothetical protein
VHGEQWPTREIDVQQGRGLLGTINAQYCSEIIRGLTFLPELQCVCVVHGHSDRIWLYSLHGSFVDSFAVHHMNNPIGLIALKTKSNTVIVAGGHVKCLHVVHLGRTSHQQINVVGQMLWKLLFAPSGIASFKTDKILVIDINNAQVFIFTEEGQQLGCIKIQDENISSIVSVVGNARGLWVADKVRSEHRATVLRVNQHGKVLTRYTGAEAGQSLGIVFGLCEVHDGHIAISDYDNECVHLINKDGVFQKLLLDKDDGFIGPTRLHFDTTTETIDDMLCFHLVF